MRRNKYSFLLLVITITVVIASCYGFDPRKPLGEKENIVGKKFVLVELFTSEGCSSCPPADALVSKMLSENKNDLFLLSFHVDYWDRLGWKDAFSKAAYSQRQRQYARHLSLEGVYTPQIIVNGNNQFVGSNEKSLRLAIDKGVQSSNLGIQVRKGDNSTMHLSYSITENTSTLLNVAFVQTEANTSVKSGENEGRQLHHVNIVHELKTIETSFSAGELDVEIPIGLRGRPFKLIAFTQQKTDYRVMGAAQAEIN